MSKLEQVAERFAHDFDYKAGTEKHPTTAALEVAKQLNDYANGSSRPAKENLVAAFNKSSLEIGNTCDLDVRDSKPYAEAAVEKDGSIVIMVNPAFCSKR